MSSALHLSGWRYRAVVLSVVCSAIGYLGFSLWGGWEDVTNAVAKVGTLGVAIALAMSLFNYILRFLRWQRYLGAFGHAVPWKDSMQIYLAGFALTTTPGKAGEALRGVLLKRWAVPYPQSFAAFFSERLSDLFAVVLLTLFGLTLYPDARPMIVVGGLLVIFGFVLLSQGAMLKRLGELIPAQGGRVLGLLKRAFDVMFEARRCHRVGMIISATFLSVVAWGAEALAFHLILHWMGMELSLTFSVFVYALAMLAGALSFMPGGLGGAEAVMVVLLVWKGMANADAVAATVLIRLATLWFAVAIGAFMLLRSERGMA